MVPSSGIRAVGLKGRVQALIDQRVAGGDEVGVQVVVMMDAVVGSTDPL